MIHSGLYYKPGSLKARSCVAGRKALIEFCDRRSVPYEICGKIVVATSAEELPRLEELCRRGSANGLEGIEMIGPERLKEIEPHAAGVKALYVPQTGIIDYLKVAGAYAQEIQSAGGEIRTSSRVVGLIQSQSESVLQTSSGDYRSKFLINCCGLHSDQVAKMLGGGGGSAGEEHRSSLFAASTTSLHRRNISWCNLIYPVPDPSFPFLGVHFTRMIKGNGGIEAGPNAVLALAREGYRKTDVNIGDLLQTVSFKGFWAMTGKYWQTGFGELYRSLSKQAFVAALQKLLPEIRSNDLVAGGSGVRAQAVSISGALVDDFVIKESRNAIHVLNAPSPGATASLAIGQSIAAMAAKNFELKN